MLDSHLLQVNISLKSCKWPITIFEHFYTIFPTDHKQVTVLLWWQCPNTKMHKDSSCITNGTKGLVLLYKTLNYITNI